MPESLSQIHSITIICWIAASVSVIVIGLRLLSKQRTKSLGSDDWLIALGTFLLILYAIYVTLLAHFGGFQPVSSLSPSETRAVNIAIYVGVPIASLVFLPFKLGLAVYVLKIQGPLYQSRPIIIYMSCGLFFVVTIVSAVFLLVQCVPAAALWDDELRARGAFCLDRVVLRRLNYTYGAVNAYIDLLLVVYPICMFWTLRISRRKLAGLCILFGVGAVAALFCCLRTVYLSRAYEGTNKIWDRYLSVLFCLLECMTMVLGVSLPTLWSLWRTLSKEKGDNDRLIGDRGVISSRQNHSATSDIELQQF